MRRGYTGLKREKPKKLGGRGGGKYWLAVLAAAAVLFWAQARWFEGARKRGAARLDSPVAEKIANKMLAMKGLAPEEDGGAGGKSAGNAAGAVGYGAGAAGGAGGAIREEVRACETCEGTGKTEDGGRCPLCYGHGARLLRRVEGVERLCPSCVGMGRVMGEDGEAETCPRCGGRGVE